MSEKKFPVLLAIESSCDDTAAAVMHGGILLSNVTAQQVVHARYGGVVPELASRKHQENIVAVVTKAMKDADTSFQDLDAVAFTRGPGLLGSLLVGTSYAKGLALALDKPLIAVDHMQAHILAHFIEEPKPVFPFLCLTVSGGHTQIVLVSSASEMQILGRTIDDAAGEAFDKTGKMLGLPYPAGPEIDKLARQGETMFEFPEPRVQDLDFSFSGLKTSIKYFLRDRSKEDVNFIKTHLPHICASVQETIVRILLDKLESAAESTGINEIAVAGGVSANSGLRTRLAERAERLGWNIYIPKLAYCTDNAAMIAMAAHFQYLDRDFADLSVAPEVRLKFSV